jgi:hypothetical protein
MAAMRVLFHNRCFDGACSASIFTRFHRTCVAPETVYEYRGMAHRAGPAYDASDFGSDENAIVDFKYSSSPEVTWWFDHHQSGFPTLEDRAHFEHGQADGTLRMRQFFDPNYISCTGFIAQIARTHFGFETAPLADLIHWANLIDGAKYESAQAAVEMPEPAMKLTMVIEGAPDDSLITRLIPLLTEMSLDAVLDQDFVQEQFGPLFEKHKAAIELIRERAKLDRGVIGFDLTDQPTEGYSKFIPYYLLPEATYVVGLSRSSSRVKISVGTSPWTPLPPSSLINLAAICERYGGGGHARVGAISFPVDREEDARTAAEEIRAELRA